MIQATAKPAEFYDTEWSNRWHDMKVYSPVARHTRRLIRRYLDKVDFSSVLDIGCVLVVVVAIDQVHVSVPVHVGQLGVEAATRALVDLVLGPAVAGLLHPEQGGASTVLRQDDVLVAVAVQPFHERVSYNKQESQ